MVVVPMSTLTIHQKSILMALERTGPMKALFFEEDALDGLFKMRPRLIALCRGHQDPVVDITAEGRKELNRDG
jgi:hypothetical protein